MTDICCTIYAGGDKPKMFSIEKTENCIIPVYSNGKEMDGLCGFTDHAKEYNPCLTISARGTIGYVVKHIEPFVPIVRLIVAVPNSQLIDIDYFRYVMMFTNFNSTGGTIPQLTVPDIKGYRILVPKIELQQQVVKRIREYEAEISQLEAVMQNIIRQKQEVIKKYL